MYRRSSMLAAVALLAACGPIRRDGPAAQSAFVVFRNESLDQAAVYVIAQSGLRTRIGTVSSNRTDTLKVAPTAIGGGGTVTILADILSRRRSPTSGPVTLMAGERVHVTLPSNQSMLSVLPPRDP